MLHILNIFFCICLSTSISYYCSKEGLLLNDIPVMYYCLAIVLLIHLLIFIPSYFNKTEKFFDITGTLAFVCMIIFALYSKYSIIGFIDIHSFILAVLISLWSLRLGLFLFYRILKFGQDDRFSEIKNSFIPFLSVWVLSATWVFITSLSALTILTSDITNEINVIMRELEFFTYKVDFFTYFGIFIWCFGFLFEIISDMQKIRFKSNPNNQEQFIKHGLWSVSRHPNYFGEIILWFGISVIAFPLLSGWQYISLISPIFVYFLLTSVSGINLLEKKANQKWNNSKSYQKYKKKTPQLIPYFWN